MVTSAHAPDPERIVFIDNAYQRSLDHTGRLCDRNRAREKWDGNPRSQSCPFRSWYVLAPMENRAAPSCSGPPISSRQLNAPGVCRCRLKNLLSAVTFGVLIPHHPIEMVPDDQVRSAAPENNDPLPVPVMVKQESQRIRPILRRYPSVVLV